MQQPADQLLSRSEALLGQRRRQVALAPADPSQRRLGITADRGLHQIVQRLQKTRLRVGRRLAATSRSAHPLAELSGADLQVGQATADCAAGNPRRTEHRLDPAASGSPRLTRREQAASSFVQKRGHRLEASLDGGRVDHRIRINLQIAQAHRFPCDRLFRLKP